MYEKLDYIAILGRAGTRQLKDVLTDFKSLMSRIKGGRKPEKQELEDWTWYAGVLSNELNRFPEMRKMMSECKTQEEFSQKLNALLGDLK